MKVLGRWVTVGFAILAFVLSAAIGVVVAIQIMTLMMSAKIPNRFDGTTLAVFSLVYYPVLVVALVLASRLSGSNVLAYLGLDIPRRRHIVVTVAGLTVWIVFVETLELVLDRDTSSWMLKFAQADGSLIWLWIVVAAPIGEEILFRGFMFRGFVHAPRDAIPSIVVISLIWSLTHTQYDWLGIAEIFVFGVLLGLVRWRTGSTTLTILLHMLINLKSMIAMEFMLG
jgi:membrane protease YdiL (CAAX protease family)